ncbi:MAG: hypothetical protein OXB86_03555 [Bdellovibrionales bacterium]|nr:hypothetical protein [Bdellovibrionales bacterium]
MEKRKSKLAAEEVLPKSALDRNTEALELYKETDSLLKETANILEQMDIALGRKKVYKYSSSSTQNCEINHNVVSLTTESYQV